MNPIKYRLYFTITHVEKISDWVECHNDLTGDTKYMHILDIYPANIKYYTQYLYDMETFASVIDTITNIFEFKSDYEKLNIISKYYKTNAWIAQNQFCVVHSIGLY